MPFLGEDGTHGAETAQLACALLGKDELELPHIVIEHIPSLSESGRDGLSQGVLDMGEALHADEVFLIDAQLAVIAQADRSNLQLTVAPIADCHGVAAMQRQLTAHLMGVGCRHAVDGHDAVTDGHSGKCSRRSFAYLAQHHRHPYVYELRQSLLVSQEMCAECIRQSYGKTGAATFDGHVVAQQERRTQGIVVPDFLAVHGHDEVTVFEADGFGQFAVVDAVRQVLGFYDILAVMPAQTDVDDDGQDQVVEHAAHHNHKPRETALLDKGIRTLEVGRPAVVGLVNHTDYGAVTAQRYPANAVLGVARIDQLGEMDEVQQMQAFFVPAQKGKVGGIEEEIELLYSDLEDACPHEVAQLMYKDKDG